MKHAMLALLALTLVGTAHCQLPRGWEFSSLSPSSYTAGSDSSVFHSGKASGSLRSKEQTSSRNFAVLLQKVDARSFQNSRVRMSGYIRSREVTGWAGMWMRVDARKGPPLEFDNMQNRPIRGSSDWTRYSIELNLPAESDSLHFGLLLAGSGQAWLDDVVFEKLGVALPASKERQRLRHLPLHPINLDFED